MVYEQTIELLGGASGVLGSAARVGEFHCQDLTATQTLSQWAAGCCSLLLSCSFHCRRFCRASWLHLDTEINLCLCAWAYTSTDHLLATRNVVWSCSGWPEWKWQLALPKLLEHPVAPRSPTGCRQVWTVWVGRDFLFCKPCNIYFSTAWLGQR